MHGSSAYLGGGGEAVEVVALGGKPVGEVAGVALLFESIADDLLAGGEPTLETVGGTVQAGLVTGDLLVETADHGRHVGVPALLGVDLPCAQSAASFRAACRSRQRAPISAALSACWRA